MSRLTLPWIPPGDVQLLRVLTGDAAAAAAAWHDWQDGQDLDEVSWRTMRLLAAVIGRLDSLSIPATEQPRLQGIRRYCWSNGQTKLAQALPSLAVLQHAGLPVLVLKGATAIATGDATPADRYVGDIDLLVPPAAADQALDLLAGQGWLPQSGGSLARVKGRGMPRHHAVNLVRGKGGELDLHWAFLLQNRAQGDDEVLWATAESARLGGMEIRCPAPPFRLLQALTQGAQWSSGNAADWAIDALALLRRPTFDWALFEREVAARHLEALVGVTLGFLARGVGVTLPPVAARLAEANPGEPWAAEALALQRPDATRDRTANAVLLRAQRRRSAGRPLHFAQRLREPRLRWPRLALALARHRVALTVEPQAAGPVVLRLPASAPTTGWRWLLVRIAAGEKPQRRRRLDVIAGLDWVVRWRHRGQRAWHGAILPAQLPEAPLTLAPYRDLRRVGEGGEMLRRQDLPVRVLEAWLAR